MYRTKILPILLYGTEIWSLTFRQVCLSPSRHVGVDTNFLTVAPNIWGSSVCNLLPVTTLAPGIGKFLQPCINGRLLQPCTNGRLLQPCINGRFSAERICEQGAEGDIRGAGEAVEG
jgi:hypothetical protein